MRSSRIIGTVAIIAALVLGSPSKVAADVCGALATVSPSWGPPGTTFVFKTNLGSPSDLYLYRNGHLVKTDYLPGHGFIRYPITTKSGDLGSWRVRGEVRGTPNCAAEARFTVGFAPETDIEPVAAPLHDSDPWSTVLLVTVGLAGFSVALGRLAPDRRTA
jgi:hypothetical protein